MLASSQTLPSVVILGLGLAQAHLTSRATTGHTPRDWAQHPNATGSWPIHGIDISKPLTSVPDADAYGEGNGWSIDVTLTYNRTDDGPSSPRKNRHTVILQAPERPFEVLDASNSSARYDVCARVWYKTTWSGDQRTKLEEDADGSCNGAIPDACVGDLKHSLLRDGSCLGDADLPESCEAALADAGIARSAPVSTIADALDETSPSFELAGAATDPTAKSEHDASEQTYDEAVAQVFAVLLGWEYDDGEKRSAYSVFRCVRADQVIESSRDPEEPSSSCRRAASLGLLFLGLTLALGVH